MTIPEMSRAHRRPKKEIAEMLALHYHEPLVIHVYRWRGHKVRVYSAAYAFGVRLHQDVGNDIGMTTC